MKLSAVLNCTVDELLREKYKAVEVHIVQPRSTIPGNTGIEIALPVKSGAIGSASVAEVVRGQKGVPGELVGVPESGASIGSVDVNTDAGIFGTASALQGYQTMPVAAAGEVVPGEALILSTVCGNTPQTYRVQITRVDRSGEDLRQICLQVTDPHLLTLTGGIVQGMSGSPIIQNGKLVGAVTHVLVEEPSRGYGILMESMLQAAA